MRNEKLDSVQEMILNEAKIKAVIGTIVASCRSNSADQLM